MPKGAASRRKAENEKEGEGARLMDGHAEMRDGFRTRGEGAIDPVDRI